ASDHPRATLPEGGPGGEAHLAPHELAAGDRQLAVGPDADVPDDAARWPGHRHRPTVERENRAVSGGADNRVGAVAPAGVHPVRLHALTHAPRVLLTPRRRTHVVVVVAAGRAVVLRGAETGRRHAAQLALVHRAVRLLRVRLEAHPHAGGVLLAAGRRAQVAVGVAARRAVVLRRAEAGRRHAAQVALVHRTVRL